MASEHRSSGSMSRSRDLYRSHDHDMIVGGGEGGDGEGYRELSPEEPQELGEVDSLNPYLEQQAQKQKSLAAFLPILGWLPSYNLTKLQGDVVSGISTGAMIIPQALAYSTLAGLPPTMGLYTGFFALIIYSLLGQCGQLSIGPDAMTAMLIRSFLTSFATDKDLDNIDPVILANGLALMVGVFLTILGLFRFGFIDNILSKAVLRGFVTAVALIIMIEQLSNLFAIPMPKTIEFASEKLLYLIEHINEVKLFNLGVGVVSVGFLLLLSFLKRWLKWIVFVPGILILVVAGMSFAYFAKLPNEELPLLGTMPAGGFSLPKLPGVFSMSILQTAHLIDAAVVISIVGFVESVVVAKEFSAKHHYQVSSNSELLALGGSNIVASFFRSFPTFGSLPRSGVANATGAKTPLAGLVTATLLGICIQFLIPTFAYMPRVIMAAIIFRASLLLIEEHEIIYMFKVRAWNDAMMMIIVGVLTFLLGIEKGIIIAIGISIFMVVKRTTLPRMALLGRTPNGKLRSKAENEQAEPIDGVLLVRLEEKYLYYANIGQTQALLTRHLEEALNYARWCHQRRLGFGDNNTNNHSDPPFSVILNMKWVENMDVSAQLAVEELVEELHSRGIGLYLVRLHQDLQVRFERSGLVAKIGLDNLCLTNGLALQAALDRARLLEKEGHLAHQHP